METISALNGSQLAATQQSITEYLAKTYQYVHVPKMNVIHDCLGILIKERKIYHTGNGYFVSTHSPFDKPAESPKENGDALKAKDSKCVACEVISKGKTAKAEKAKRRVKEKENGKVRTPDKEVEKTERKKSVANENSKRVEDEKDLKPPTPRKEEETNRTPSETTSESGASEGATKKVKKQKKGVLEHLSCFIKGKSFSTLDVEETKQEQTPKAPSPPSKCTPTPGTAPLAIQEDVSPSLQRSVQFRTQRTLSAPAGNPSFQANVSKKELEAFSKKQIKSVVPNSRQLARSKSFVAPEKRPMPPTPVMRSHSFSAPSTKAARQILIESAPGTWDRRMRMNYGDIIRNSPARQTIHVSRPSSCNIGIVRPLSGTTQQRPLSRNNSMKKELPHKKGSSLSPPSTPRNQLTPSSTPRLKGKSQGRTNLTVMRSRSFTEPGMLKSANRQISHRATISGPYLESPLQQLLARNPNRYILPPSTGVRVTVPSKGRHFAPGKHPTKPTKRTPPSSPLRKQPVVSQQAFAQKPKPGVPPNRNDCTSPVCYDTSMINDRVKNCMCNGINNADATRFVPFFQQNYNRNKRDDVSSEHICIEEMTTSASDVTLMGDENGETGDENESTPLGVYKKGTGEGVNDSLTFIGII